MSAGQPGGRETPPPLSPADARICTDIGRAAASDATEAIIRKCNLMPPGQRVIVLRIALGLIAQKARALTQVMGPSRIDAALAVTDDVIEATLRRLVEKAR
jgi:hypothetical protein